MLSTTRQRLHHEAFHLLGTIRMYKNMLPGSNEAQREAITAALDKCKDELNTIEQTLFSNFKIKHNIYEN